LASDGVTAESSWTTGQAPVSLQSLTTHACFLTRFAGRFQGGGEEVGVFKNDAGFYELSGQSEQASTAAAARCIPMPSVSVNFPTQLGGSATVTMDPQRNGACYLVRAQGLFAARGDFVETEWTGTAWQLQQQVMAAGPMRVFGACFGRNNGSDVPTL
jgi:hypothetical protein